MIYNYMIYSMCVTVPLLSSMQDNLLEENFSAYWGPGGQIKQISKITGQILPL